MGLTRAKALPSKTNNKVVFFFKHVAMHLNDERPVYTDSARVARAQARERRELEHK